VLVPVATRVGRQAKGGRIIRSGVVDLQFPAVFRKVREGYIAFVEEFPGANTQGATLEEARTNLRPLS
jgi:hypothetical protein